ncbi:MAG: serine/threonine protein kinase [Anaerolineae bacterium]|nr:serine/threonine protein kinase [Phycisphaerae bacterium]
MSNVPTGPFDDSTENTWALDRAAPAADMGTGATVATEHRPERVGPYRIIELLGEGGMGEVYRAERLHPIRQTVAVKVIKLGFASREVVRRFESERQTLALMDHPGIAKVFDAGTTDTGRPYFVMEYVDGKAITHFCDDNRLSITDRLKLFTNVCDAIAHAHTKAIIHRDIKPSNVMAYAHDGTFTTKVIDFGVAKALTGDRLSEQTFQTVRGQAVGTYESMSPEQAEGSPDIDTRTDVYSLGVLLYELLTGAKPFDHGTFSKSADAEIKRIIREVEPPRPSTRLSGLGQDASKFAERRQAKLDSLSRQLRSELEWIPLMAMRKDRARRYASALQLKEDVQNYLDGKPLNAGPERRSYRLKKYVTRHRRGLLTTAAVVTLLIGTFAYYVRSLRAEQVKTKLALVESEKQAKIARDSNGFLAEIFATAQPNQSLGAQVTVVEAMKSAVTKLERKSKVEPLTEATVRYIVGTTLRSLGSYDEALPQLRRAAELDQKYRSASDPQISLTMIDLGLLFMHQGRVAEAEPLYREALRLRQSTLPADSPDVAQAMSHLATLLKDQGKFAEAEPMLRQALAIRRKALPADDPDIATSLNSLALLLFTQGKLDEAEPLVRETLRMRQASLPPGHPNIAQSLNNLGTLLKDQKKFAEAEPLCREALKLRREALPAGHRDIGMAAHNLAGVLQPLGKLDEAESLYREAMSIRKAALPAGNPTITLSANQLAALLLTRGRFVDAGAIYHDAIENARKSTPRDDVALATALSGLGQALLASDKPSDAENYLREALELRRKKFGARAGPTTLSAGPLAAILDQTNRRAEAAALRAECGLTEPTTQPLP